MIDFTEIHWTPNYIHEMRLILRECETLEHRKYVINVLIEHGGSSTLYDFMTKLKEYIECHRYDWSGRNMDEMFNKYTMIESLYYDLMEVVGGPDCWRAEAIDYDSDTSTVCVMSEVETVDAESDTE